ncbi:MAG: STAS domain-containing protein [Chitinivibrionales bacterium]|nr:STAS domain-containing protein [Chitinivibrionales bacterium]
MSQNKKNTQSEHASVRIVLPRTIESDQSVEIEKNILSQCPATVAKLILDFSQTETLFSVGIGLLIKLRKKMLDQGGEVVFVNVSRRLMDTFTQLNLDRVFTIADGGTGLDSLTGAENMKKKKIDDDYAFIFVAQIEDNLYKLTFSGLMSLQYDLSSFTSFIPQESVSGYVLNVESLEIIDTYGAQLVNDFLQRQCNGGCTAVFYGANPMLLEVLHLFPLLRACRYCTSELEAVEALLKVTPSL